MGWCSATEIMDTAIAAAEAVADAMLDIAAAPPAHTNAAMDEALRTFVAALAVTLRDGDWDCIEESDYFERFPQEMLGHSDDEHKAWLVENVKNAADYGEVEQVQKWSAQLAAFRKKIGES